MKIVNMAKKLQNKLLKGKQPFFIQDITEQRKLLESFPEPQNLIERSYFQYVCQAKQIPLILRIIQNTTSIFLLCNLIFMKKREVNNLHSSQSNIAVFISGLNDVSYIPEKLQEEFDQIIHQDYLFKNKLTKSDEALIKKLLKKHWRNPYFILKCAMKIGLYSEHINTYNPKAIITFSEFSFTSSLLTYYCNLRNIEHINIMHGEKLFNIRDSFVEFDRFYVWDEHYENLFIQLRAKKNQFKVEIPDALCLNADNEDKYVHVITYYLGGEDERELTSINNDLSSIDIPLDKICIRYHPRYSDINIVKKIFRGYVIENPNEVDIEKSLSMTKYAASLYSTVLYLAYVNGKKVVINDLSSPKKYELLDDLNYIMIKKPHIKLSELLIETM